MSSTTEYVDIIQEYTAVKLDEYVKEYVPDASQKEVREHIEA